MTERSLPEETIFAHASEIESTAERQAYLERACGADPNLRAEIEALLRCDARTGDLLDLPEMPAAIADQPGIERAGSVIGPYKLLREIGEGGMGAVWLAEQEHPVRRKVALKIIKSGMDSRQVAARFALERQALAMMEHPNIAKVLDAGTTESGRPYFAMELVNGSPIIRYCDDHHMCLRERLKLFLPVCHAVQHAHQKGIIHRDLKPSNVLVALYDDIPAPKIIDFGVAKATGHKLTDGTTFTEHGQLVGTFEYMSPEQASFNALDIDTRTDIYSLGVLLYELLTGSTPYRERLREAAFDEILRIIREEEPVRPSSRLSEFQRAGLPGRADASPATDRPTELTEPEPSTASIEVRRQMEPTQVRRLIKGDLDWIVMKALEKDRNRRYETANALAVDLQRYLADEPVSACPPSVRYQVGKFVRRNKGTVLAASLVILALVGGIFGTTWGLIRAEQASRNALAAQRAEATRAEGERRAREEAQRRLAQIEKGAETLVSVIRDLDPMTAERERVPLRVLVGRRLREAAQQLDGEAVGDPLVMARLQHVLGVSLRESGDLEQAERVLVKAGRTRGRLLGADHLDTVATQHQLASLYRDQGKHTQAEALFQHVLATRTAVLGADHPETLSGRHDLAWLYQSQGKHAQAEARYQEVLAARTIALGADHPDTLTTQHRLAALYRSRGKDAKAEPLLKQVLAIRTTRLGADNLDTVATQQQLASLYLGQEKYAQADPLYREVLAVRTAKLGADHPDTLTTRQHLAAVRLGMGQCAQAEALYQEVLAARTATLGADHPDTLSSRNDLASLYQCQEKYGPAEAMYQEALATGVTRLGADHRVLLISRGGLAMLYRSMKKLDQSIPLLEETLRLSKAKFDHEHPDTLGVQAHLGVNYCDAGRFDDGIPLLEEVYRKSRGQPRLGWVGKALLTAYARAGKTAEATALVIGRVQTARERIPVDRPLLAAELAAMGKALLDATAYAAAEPLLRESLALAEEQAPGAWSTHHVRSLLGGALLGQQKYADAEPLLVQGYEGLKRRAVQVPPEQQSNVATALERLVQLYDAWGRRDEAAKWRKDSEEAKEQP
jgi:serine/threonine protein kinase/tetratricopeptide (TPR) repeat protein